MPLQLKVAELSESEKEDESGPELDFFREFKFISKPGLGQNQAHPCHCQQEAETDENKSSGPFFFWP